MSFDEATNFIQFDSTHFADHPYAWALDDAGNRLAVTIERTYHQSWGPGGGPFRYQTLSISSTTANISRLIIAGNGGSSTVDSISYSASVPEPETMALLLVGLVGAGVTTRQRRKGATQ